jgi:hypothetical protein
VYPSISDKAFTILCHVGAFLNALAGTYLYIYLHSLNKANKIKSVFYMINSCSFVQYSVAMYQKILKVLSSEMDPAEIRLIR